MVALKTQRSSWKGDGVVLLKDKAREMTHPIFNGPKKKSSVFACEQDLTNLSPFFDPKKKKSLPFGPHNKSIPNSTAASLSLSLHVFAEGDLSVLIFQIFHFLFSFLFHLQSSLFLGDLKRYGKTHTLLLFGFWSLWSELIELKARLSS